MCHALRLSPLPPPLYGGGGPKGRRGKAPVEVKLILDLKLPGIATAAFPLRPLRGGTSRFEVADTRSFQMA
jgi:hypothetical protein